MVVVEINDVYVVVVAKGCSFVAVVLYHLQVVPLYPGNAEMETVWEPHTAVSRKIGIERFVSTAISPDELTTAIL